MTIHLALEASKRLDGRLGTTFIQRDIICMSAMQDGT